MGRRSRRRARRGGAGGAGIVLIAVGVGAVVGIVGLFLVVGGGGDDGGERLPPEGALELTAEDHVLGDPEAPVTLIEYADFQCPFCRAFAIGIEPTLRADYVDSGQARFVFRHFPFIGDESFRAAEASECAGEQDAFWEYHDKLYAEQQGENEGAFSDANLVQFAGDLGLDTAAFDGCLASDRYAERVRQSGELAAGFVGSTPSLFVDGEMIKGLQDYETYQSAIEDALDPGN